MLNEPGTMVFIVFARALNSDNQVCDTFLERGPAPQFMHLALNGPH